MTTSKTKIKISGDKDWNQVFRLLSWWDEETIRTAKIMVVGAGALGNEVLKNLALFNVGNILVVDFDTIEYSNLSRSVLYRESDAIHNRNKASVAADRVKDINANVKVLSMNGDVGIDIGLGVFKRMDVVIGCLDNRLARLYLNRLSHRVNVTWVDGAIENLAGQLNVYKPKVSCYECQLTDQEWDNIRFKMGCPDIARRNKAAGRIPTTPISSSVIGALQVQEALKVIYKNDEQSLAGHTFYYEGMNNLYTMYKSYKLADECPSHYPIDDYIEAPELSNTSTIRDFMLWCADYFKTTKITLQLDHEVALQIQSSTTDNSFDILKAKPHLSDKYLLEFQTTPDEEFVISDTISCIDYDNNYNDKLLSEFGIPPLHMVQVETDLDVYFVELSKDISILDFK